MAGLNDLLTFGMVLTILGVMGLVGIYVNEKVADKTALTANDTFINASNDIVDSVESGWDFAEIIVIVAAAAIIIGLIVMAFPFKF